MPKDLFNVGQIENQSANYVHATIQAWNQCPSIVKKQLDEQYKKINTVTTELRECKLKLNQKKAEFDRHAKVEMQVELTKYKDKIEQQFRKKAEEDKLKMNKLKV